MDRKLTLSDEHLPADIIKLVIDQHGPVIRLSYMEIASGINRLLHRGIPKEVIAQVVSETVEALAKEASAIPQNQQQ
jgi:S-ribosylhomocysteine lyase LuxS involved in autoinducer biosynthesis